MESHLIKWQLIIIENMFWKHNKEVKFLYLSSTYKVIQLISFLILKEID